MPLHYVHTKHLMAYLNHLYYTLKHSVHMVFECHRMFESVSKFDSPLATHAASSSDMQKNLFQFPLNKDVKVFI